MTGVTSLVEQTLRQRMESGDLPPGGKLPSERTLANEFQVGRTTVRLVLTRLTAEGLVCAEYVQKFWAVLTRFGDAACLTPGASVIGLDGDDVRPEWVRRLREKHGLPVTQIPGTVCACCHDPPVVVHSVSSDYAGDPPEVEERATCPPGGSGTTWGGPQQRDPGARSTATIAHVTVTMSQGLTMGRGEHVGSDRQPSEPRTPHVAPVIPPGRSHRLCGGGAPLVHPRSGLATAVW